MRTSPNPLRVPGWELGCLAVLVGFYLIGLMLFGDNGSAAINEAGPGLLALILGAAATQAALSSRSVFWTGLFWMRVATAIYFGIGSVIEPWLNEASRGALLAFFEATPNQIMKFNLMTAGCAFTLLATVRLADSVLPRRARFSYPARFDGMLLTSGLMFGVVGFSVKYFISIPAWLGVFGDIVIPGMLLQLVWLAPVSLFLLTYWCLRNAPNLMPLVLVGVLADSLTGAILFQKTESLTPVLMFMLAVLHHRTTVLRLCLAVLVSVVMFQYLQPAVSYGRGVVWERYGDQISAPLSERLGILADYIVDGDGGENDDLQGWLLRISYATSAAPAIALYDAGQPGDSLNYLAYIFIPRVLWPNKPVFDMGTQYTILINGTDTSSTWMGYFAETYWNLGWLGIPIVMIPLGFVFFGTGRYAIWVIENGQWLHFPSVFLAMRMGIRVDGVIATDVGSTILTMLLYYPVAKILTSIVQGTGRPLRTTQRPFPGERLRA